MKDQFRRILDLVRRTGDTMIVTDPDAEDVYVVMDIEQYEMLLDVTGDIEDEGFEGDVLDFPGEGELSSDVEEPVEIHPSASDDFSPENIWEAMKPANEEGETWDPAAMNEEELADLERQYKAFASRNVKTAMEEVQKPEEKIPEKPVILEAEDDELGEEQFYLEPVE